MALLKGGRFIPDPWRRVGDDEEIEEAIEERAPLLVSLLRWRAEREGLIARRGKTGVLLPNSEDPAALAGDLGHLDLIALEFPVFRDGRAYSQARILREHMGWQGELRATGDVLRDQFFFMARCGFDAFEVGAGADEQAWREAMAELTSWYQPSGGLPGETILSRRRGRNARG